MSYEVEKFARGLDGRFFCCGARRWASLDDAMEYFRRFADAQKNVLGNGIRIDLRVRKGRKVLASVGGVMHNPTVIRVFD